MPDIVELPKKRFFCISNVEIVGNDAYFILLRSIPWYPVKAKIDVQKQKFELIAMTQEDFKNIFTDMLNSSCLSSLTYL